LLPQPDRVPLAVAMFTKRFGCIAEASRQLGRPSAKQIVLPLGVGRSDLYLIHRLPTRRSGMTSLSSFVLLFV
jgi:hypothetical protein